VVSRGAGHRENAGEPATTDRRAAAIAAIASVALFAPLVIPLLTGQVFAMGDLADFHLPMRRLYQSALENGGSIIWTPRMFGGFYIHAEGQVGVLHPLHLVLYRTLPLRIAFSLEIIASYLFSYAGTWLLLRQWGFARAASLTGAMAFTFSGFNLLHLLHVNAVAIVAHIPWLLWSLQTLLFGSRRSRPIAVIGISVSTASILLLGYPQYVWMAGLVCVAWFAIRGHHAAWRDVVLAAAAASAGLMLGSLQLLPTLDLLQHSQRRALESGFALTFSMHPLNLVQLLSPYILPGRVYADSSEMYVHEFGIYDGALSTIAVFWVLLRWRQLELRTAAMFGLLLVTGGVILALGRYSGFYQLLASLPLLETLRGSSRHIVLAHLGFAILAAVTVDDLLRLATRRERGDKASAWLWTPAVASTLIGALALTVFGDAATSGVRMSPTLIVVGASFMALTTLLVLDASRGAAYGVLIVMPLLALDLGLWGYSYVFSGGVRSVQQIADTANAPPAAPGSMLHQTSRSVSPNLLLLRNFSVARPYVGLQPARVMPLSTTSQLRIAGIDWAEAASGWQAVADVMPRARIVANAIVAKDPVAELGGIDVRTTALVDREMPPLTSDATSRLIEDVPGRIAVDVDATAAALLCLTEAYDSGWISSTSDGRELPTVRVYGDFLGVLLDPGKYRVTLSFAPRSLRLGEYLAVAGLLSTFALAFAAMPRRTPSRKAA
jgi:hypothetical protein